MTLEYKAACEAHNAALAIFGAATKAYRARQIGDAEFIAAAKVKKAADAEFDIAFEIEANQPEPPTAAEMEASTQINLF